LKTTISFQKVLLLFFAFIAALIFIRVIYSGRFSFIFLVWNLFLAWVPFIISSSFKSVVKIEKYKQFFIFSVWLLFFPNALYLVTDLIHLDLETTVPKWFDAILLFTSCIIGLMMAFISLIRVEKYLSYHFSHKIVNAQIAFILFLASFGVYLGRFLRWNSWDIISNPFDLLISIIRRFIFPLQHLQTWGVTLMLTILFYLLYLTIKKLPGYLNQAMH
jgi:uncharacterized membrane protein